MTNYLTTFDKIDRRNLLPNSEPASPIVLNSELGELASPIVLNFETDLPIVLNPDVGCMLIFLLDILEAHEHVQICVPLFNYGFSAWIWCILTFLNDGLMLKDIYYHIMCLITKFLVFLSWFYKLKFNFKSALFFYSKLLFHFSLILVFYKLGRCLITCILNILLYWNVFKPLSMFGLVRFMW